jgi:hypothetical protein
MRLRLSGVEKVSDPLSTDELFGARRRALERCLQTGHDRRTAFVTA